MVIGGLQKLTLLDYPEKVACTVFTVGCNYRCPFCHNGPLVLDKESVIGTNEIFEFLKKRQGTLDGVCISGGEPLLQQDLEAFAREIKAMGFLVKIDTNGSFPGRLKEMIAEGLVDYVAMDIKNSPEGYRRTAGLEVADMAPVYESVRLLMEGRVAYEFRTTVVREFHQKADFEKIGDWIQGAEQYFLQQYIDSPHTLKKGLHGYSREIMDQALEIVRRKIPHARLRGL